MQLGGSIDASCPFIFSRVSGLARFLDGFDKGTTSNFMQISEKVRRRPANDTINVQGRKHEPYKESSNSPRPINVRELKCKVKNTLFIFFYMKRIVYRD
jgi:hypothetical protein